MNKEYFEKVKSKEALLILTDETDSVIFSTQVSPVSSFYTEYYEGKINSKNIILYTNQLGIALALASDKLNIIEYNAYQASEPSIEMIENKHIPLYYEQVIDLVKSSEDSSKVCPVEEYLFSNMDKEVQDEYINKKYNKSASTQCGI